MVTHDTALASQAEETIVMSDGKISVVGWPSKAVHQNEL
jgi:ABC-type lipoprotein export system ATPase subunit